MGSLGGEWYYPNGNVVLGATMITDQNTIVRLRNAPHVVRLARRSTSALDPTGLYCCVIPTMGGERKFCANIGKKNSSCVRYVLCSCIYCIVVCLSLPPLTNGMISYSDPTLGVGSVATYSCTAGLVLDGDSTRTCQSSGTWSGSSPVCKGHTLVAPVSLFA